MLGFMDTLKEDAKEWIWEDARDRWVAEIDVDDEHGKGAEDDAVT